MRRDGIIWHRRFAWHRRGDIARDSVFHFHARVRARGSVMANSKLAARTGVNRPLMREVSIECWAILDLLEGVSERSDSNTVLHAPRSRRQPSCLATALRNRKHFLNKETGIPSLTHRELEKPSGAPRS